MHDARTVANYLINKAIDDGRPFTPLQVIKLTYYCHAWMLALRGRSLFKQDVEAWQYGPVVGAVYRSLKHWGRNLIHRPIDGIESARFDEDEERVINMTYEYYKKYSGIELSALTHGKNTPWHQIWSKHTSFLWRVFGKTTIIDNQLIENYYRDVAIRNGWDGEIDG